VSAGDLTATAATGFLVAGPYPGQTTAKTLEPIRYDHLDDMIQTIGTGLAASVVSPTILGASDKAGTKRPVIGSGEFTYEVYHDWGELPAGIKYGNTHGVCEDSRGQIYIHHTVHATSDRHDTMVVFDQHGKFVRSWGAEFEGGAHGLHIRR